MDSTAEHPIVRMKPFCGQALLKDRSATTETQNQALTKPDLASGALRPLSLTFHPV